MTGPGARAAAGPTRFVFVHPHLRLGGAETQTVAIANALTQAGHHCTVVLHARIGELVPELDRRIDVIDLGFTSHWRIPFGAVRAFKVLRSLPPSAVIVRLWSSISMVGAIHGRLRHHSITYVEDLDPRDHTDYIRFGHIKQAIIGRVFRRHEEALVANTEHVADAMVEAYRLHTRPPVIPCGVDAARITQLAAEPASTSPRTPGVPRVVTVGSLIQRKGILELADALGASERRLEWTVVGAGPLGASLVDRVAHFPTLALNAVGATTNPYPLIAESDVLVHGASSESFGIVLVEALALGIPVLANAANGPSEIAQHLPGAPIETVNMSQHAEFTAALQRALESKRGTGDIGPYGLDECVASWVRRASKAGSW